jgi:hypothetical protein
LTPVRPIKIEVIQPESYVEWIVYDTKSGWFSKNQPLQEQVR